LKPLDPVARDAGAILVIVSKLVQTAMAMVSSTKIRTMNVNARHAVALVLYRTTTTMKK
jgi:hypothetical protein